MRLAKIRLTEKWDQQEVCFNSSGAEKICIRLGDDYALAKDRKKIMPAPLGPTRGIN